jgi:hypothetical protein
MATTRKDRSSPYTLAAELREIYSTLTASKCHSSEIGARIEAWRETWPKRVSVHTRGFIDGVHHILRENMWKEVEFCYRAPDGTIYSTAKKGQATIHRSVDELYDAGRGHELGGWKSAFLYRNSDRNYTDWHK